MDESSMHFGITTSPCVREPTNTVERCAAIAIAQTTQEVSVPKAQAVWKHKYV